MSPIVQFKGIREGLLVILGEGEWAELKQSLLSQVDEQIDFLRGGKLYLDVGNHILHAVELSRLRDAISERGLNLWGVLSSSPTTEQTAQVLGLATRLSRPSSRTQFRSTAAPETHLEMGEEAILVRRTLRSGYSLKYPGNVIVIGDVNPGAEIVAGGSVMVWGRLRGSVHAGADGDGNAMICALDLSPMQVRIAGEVITMPQRKGKAQPEIIRLQDNTARSEVWVPGKR